MKSFSQSNRSADIHLLQRLSLLLQSCVVPTAKDVLLKVFGATTMSDMQHVVKRDEATKVGEIKMSTTSDIRPTLFIPNKAMLSAALTMVPETLVIHVSIRISCGIPWCWKIFQLHRMECKYLHCCIL